MSHRVACDELVIPMRFYVPFCRRCALLNLWLYSRGKIRRKLFRHSITTIEMRTFRSKLDQRWASLYPRVTNRLETENYHTRGCNDCLTALFHFDIKVCWRSADTELCVGWDNVSDHVKLPVPWNTRRDGVVSDWQVMEYQTTAGIVWTEFPNSKKIITASRVANGSIEPPPLPPYRTLSRHWNVAHVPHRNEDRSKTIPGLDINKWKNTWIS